MISFEWVLSFLIKYPLSIVLLLILILMILNENGRYKNK